MKEPAIWKFEFHEDGPLEQTFEMPSSAEVLSFGYVQGKFVIWARVHPDNEKVKRTFKVYLTGQPAGWALKNYFVGTAWSSDGGSFVGHCFEVPKRG